MAESKEYTCPVCGKQNMQTYLSEPYKWGRAECIDCGCAGPEVYTSCEESDTARWHKEAFEMFANVKGKRE